MSDMKDTEVRLDFARGERKGFPEVIFTSGKSDAQLRFIAEQIRGRRLDTAFSRMSAEQNVIVGGILEDFRYDATARFGWTAFGTPKNFSGVVAVLTAGSSDVPVAEEAALIAEFSGCEARRFYDVGVAGLHRLLGVIDEVKEADAVIVAAGMDGALPSVVAGLVPSLVIGLPTSVGYGIAEGGLSALRSMLSSCSPGIVVVNIDNGIGAGLSAALAAQHGRRARI